MSASARPEIPDLGVIVPAWNVGSTLHTALASLAGQSVVPGAVVVVDDGSSDDTVAVAERWTKHLPLEIVRHDDNRGLPAALTTGVDRLGTRLVTQFDGDDFAFPDHLETLEGLHRRHGGVISADSLLWVQGSEVGQRSWYQRRPAPPMSKQLLHLADDNWVFGILLLESALLRDVGGFRPLSACEDWDLSLRLLDAGVVITPAGHPTMLYRQSGGSLSKGERAVLAAASLLEDFAATANDRGAAAVAARAATRNRRLANLFRAYQLARDRRGLDARRAALRAVRTPPATAIRAVAMAVAPQRAVELYDRLTYQGEALDRSQDPQSPPRSGSVSVGPTVGVVMPAFNAADTLDAALASIVAQGRLPDQVVVADDCSTDDTVKVAESWADLLPITVVRQERKSGCGGSRSRAMDDLTTDLVAPLDSDDVWLPDHLELMCSIWRTKPGVVSGSGMFWNPGVSVDTTLWSDERPIPAPAGQLRQLILGNYVFVSALFDRAAALRVGGIRALPSCEDWDLWLRLVDEGAEISAVTTATALYRRTAESMSAGDKILDQEVEVVRSFMRDHDRPEVHSAGRIALRRRRARRGLKDAYRLVAEGHPQRARLAAVRALQGTPHNVSRGLALIVAPRTVAGERDRRSGVVRPDV